MSNKFRILSLLIFVFVFWASVASGDPVQESLNKEAIKAVIDNDVGAIKDLVNRGMDPNFDLGKPRNVLRLTASRDEIDMFSVLVDAGAELDHQLQEGMYFVNFVATHGSDESLKLVIEKSVDLDHLIYFDQWTVFTAMLNDLNLEMLEYVLEHGRVDINYIPTNGYSALYRNYVINDCGLDCLGVMLEHRADPSLPIKSGEMPFAEYLADVGDDAALDLIGSME